MVLKPWHFFRPKTSPQPPVDTLPCLDSGYATTDAATMTPNTKRSDDYEPGRQNPIFAENKGNSQEQLVDQIGISRQAVSKWESEQSTPDLDKIILLSDFFEVTTDYLLKGIEPVRDTGKRTKI